MNFFECHSILILLLSNSNYNPAYCLSTSAEIQELNWDFKGILNSSLNGAQPWAEQLYVGVQG